MAWDYSGDHPWCGNKSPLTGECILGCRERHGGCIVSHEDREAQLEEHRRSIRLERELIQQAEAK